MRWHYHTTVLVACVLAFFVTFFGRLAISPVVPFITDDFGISNARIGVALTGMWIAYGLSQFPSGVLADRFGERPVILVSVGGTAITGLFIAVAPMFSLFVVAVVLLGAVAGLHYSVATTLLSRTYDDIGTAIGFHSMGVPLAGLIAPVAVAWVGVRYGWRPAVALTAVVAVPVFVLFARGVRRTEPRRPNQPMRGRFEVRSIVAVLSRPPVAFTVCLAVVATFVAQGLISFLPTFLVEHRGHTATLAGVLFSVLFVLKAGSNLGVGAASDHLGRDVSLAGCMLLWSIGFVLLVVGPGFRSIAVAILLVAIGSSFFPALDPRFLDEFSRADRGAEFGLVRTIYGILGAGGPVVVGLLADVFGWAVSFAVLAGLCLLVFCALCVNRAFRLGY